MEKHWAKLTRIVEKKKLQFAAADELAELTIPRLTSWRGKDLNSMTKEELINALNELASLYHKYIRLQQPDGIDNCGD